LIRAASSRDEIPFFIVLEIGNGFIYVYVIFDKMVFTVANCPKCNTLQTIEIKDMLTAVLRCCSCLKHTKVRKADGQLIEIHEFYEDARDAINLCQKLKGKVDVGFQTGNSFNK